MDESAVSKTPPERRSPEDDRAAPWWRALEQHLTDDRNAGLWVLGLAALVFLPRLGSVGLWDPWETHYGEVAREMLVRRDFVHPHWESAYFFSKPALPLWLMAGGMALFGVETAGEGPLGAWVEWSVRLPVALIAIFAVWAVYRMGRRVAGRITGFVSAFVVVTCPQFIFVGKQAMADMPLVGLTTIGLAFFIDAVFGPESENSAPPSPALRWGSVAAVVISIGAQLVLVGAETDTVLGWASLMTSTLIGAGVVGAVLTRGRTVTARLVLFYVFVGLAALSKGLAVLAIIGPTVLLYMLFSRDWHLLVRSGVIWGGLLFLAVASPWYVVMSLFTGRDDEGLTFVQRFWIHDNLNRVSRGVHGDRGGLGYYFEQLAYGMFPWFALLPPALLHAVSHDGQLRMDGKRRTLLFLVLWGVWSYVFFSASETKFHHYIFPAVPALATVVGVWFAHVARDPGRRLQGYLAVLVAGLFAASAADMIDEPNKLVNLFTYKYDRQWPRGLYAEPALITLVAMGGTALVVTHILRQKAWQMFSFAALALAFGLWCSHVYFNLLTQHWSQYHLWQTYYEEREGNEPVYAYQLNWRGETFYSRNRIIQVMRKNANRRIRELASEPGREFILTEKGRYDTLKNALPQKLRERLRIVDQSNNNFYLTVVD